MAVGVERLELHHFAGLRVGALHFGDLEDLRGAAPASRPAPPGIRTRCGPAGWARRSAGNRFTMGAQFSRKVLAPTPSSSICRRSPRSKGEIMKMISTWPPKPACADPLEPGEVEEEELLREAEVLLQQPVADERAARVGQHAVVLVEAHRPQRIGAAGSPARPAIWARCRASMMWLQLLHSSSYSVCTRLLSPFR